MSHQNEVWWWTLNSFSFSFPPYLLISNFTRFFLVICSHICPFSQCSYHFSMTYWSFFLQSNAQKIHCISTTVASMFINHLPMSCSLKFSICIHTSWFVDDAWPAAPSEPYIIIPFGMLLTCCMLPDMATPSPGVWVEGVEGCEFGEGPTVFPVQVLLAAPEEEGPFLFLLFY